MVKYDDINKTCIKILFLQVSLIGINNFKFMGFLIQARVYQTQKIVGSWKLEKLGHEYIGILKCSGQNVTIIEFSH